MRPRGRASTPRTARQHTSACRLNERWRRFFAQGGSTFMSGFFDHVWSWLGQTMRGTSWRDVMPLGVAGIFVWSLWLYRAIMSRFSKPVINEYRTSVSVVVPSYREDPDILLECLRTWLGQNPTEVIIVPDVADTEVQRRL